MDGYAEVEDALLAGTSPARERLAEALVRISRTPRTTVLITGERGCGKRSAGRVIHRLSARRAGPLAQVGASQLASAEALAARLGASAGGTLVLAHVERLAPEAQARLLAELLDPQGSVRVVATSALDLQECVRSGGLREDLFYRLNVLSLRLPPLRERAADLPAIARSVLADLGAPERAPRLTPEAERALAAHSFPGNLRELAGVLLAALARAGDAELLGAGALALPGSRAPEVDGAPAFSLRAAEEALIARALEHTRGNRSRAARLLGINRQTLYNKLDALGAKPAG